MALREIVVEGTRWTLWSVIPSASSAGHERGVRNELAAGWVAAKCAGERRRIVPIPAGWDDWTDAELIEALERAERVPQPREG